jgi:DNA polymerase-3 subunit beta
MQVAFNPGYLLDGLAALDGPTAVLSMTDPRKPAVLAPAGEDGDIVPGYRYVIMPIRIGA